MEDFKERIEKVEDALAFGERNQDQFSEQLIRAFQTIERLSQRLAALEGRLSVLEEPEPTADDEDDAQ